MSPTKISAFWSHVDVAAADDCWLWTAAINHNGYGIFAVDGKRVAEQRVRAEIAPASPLALEQIR